MPADPTFLGARTDADAQTSHQRTERRSAEAYRSGEGPEPAERLSSEEVMALKFAAHRQLTRWANKRDLQPRQHAQRAALARAARSLANPAFADGCDLHAAGEE